MSRPLRWFTATEQVGGPRREDRGPRVHAKGYGTLLTACGLNASNLRKDWDSAFDPRLKYVCHECASTLADPALAIATYASPQA